jgi:hypothetical protein
MTNNTTSCGGLIMAVIRIYIYIKLLLLSYFPYAIKNKILIADEQERILLEL